MPQLGRKFGCIQCLFFWCNPEFSHRYHIQVFRLLDTLHMPQSSDHLTSISAELNNDKLPLAHLSINSRPPLGRLGCRGFPLTVLAKSPILRKCALIQGELCEAKSKSNKALFGFFDFARCARFLDLSRFHEVEHFSCLWWCILRKIG